MSTTRCKGTYVFPLVFQGPLRALQTPPKGGALPTLITLSPVKLIPGSMELKLLKRKENSSWNSCWCHQVQLRCRFYKNPTF